jgi:hypothetical protein
MVEGLRRRDAAGLVVRARLCGTVLDSISTRARETCVRGCLGWLLQWGTVDLPVPVVGSEVEFIKRRAVLSAPPRKKSTPAGDLVIKQVGRVWSISVLFVG